MARCGCTGTTCSCKIIGENGIIVRGAGTITNPYVISGGLALIINDTETVNLTLLGSGSQGDPYVLSADAALGLGDLEDVDTTGGSDGYVVALQADGTYALVPPSTAPVGAVATGLSLDGDGSGGDPLVVRLAALPGLEVVAAGLRVKPYTVTTEADLDSTFGALPSGSIVSDTDGSISWLKADSGWKVIIEDTGLVTDVGSNTDEETGWDVDAVQIRRRNGIVQLKIVVSTTVSRTTTADNGNGGNIDVGTIIPTEFRPVMEAPLRVLGAGDDAAFRILTTGVITMTNHAQPDFATPAGYQWSLGATYIGQG